MAKRVIKLSIQLPSGITATPELEKIAADAANAAIESATAELLEAQQLSTELAAKGICISAEEIIARKSKKAPRGQKTASRGSARKRIVLDENQRNKLIEDLKTGIKISEAASKFGISTATVMNIKTAAGLTKTRK